MENRPGATIGGPVFRNKLFFFFSTYWDRVRTGVAPSESFPLLTPIPGAAGLGAIQSTFAGDPGAAAIAGFGPYSIAAGNPQPIPVPAGLCPAGDTYTGGGACLESVTDANGATANIQVAGVTRSITGPTNDQEQLARLDWQPTEKDRFFLRFLYQNQLSLGLAGGRRDCRRRLVTTCRRRLTPSEPTGPTPSLPTSSISCAIATRTQGRLPGRRISQLRALKFRRVPGRSEFHWRTRRLELWRRCRLPAGRTVKVTQVQDNATWTHGHQTFLFGGEFDYQNSPDTGIFYYNGQPNYGNSQQPAGSAGCALPPGASSYRLSGERSI